MASATPVTVGIVSPGEMGHAIGAVLHHAGVRVITTLRGRSRRTATLAGEAGIGDVGDDDTLVREADVLFSVLVPAQAKDAAERLAVAVAATGTHPLVADLNAIAPSTVRQIGTRLTAAGARFADGGIIGGPPRPGQAGPRIYVSGEHAAELVGLKQYGLDVRVAGDEIGQASGLKMCYAALTKGLTALATELLTAGTAMGLSEVLQAELESSQPALLTGIRRSVPQMPPKAYRWVGEMEEIAATFGDLGLPPHILQGAADLYRLVGETDLAAETPERRRRGQTLEDVIAILVAHLEARRPPSAPSGSGEDSLGAAGRGTPSPTGRPTSGRNPGPG